MVGHYVTDRRPGNTGHNCRLPDRQVVLFQELR
nr:MAG TPA: hypothetical protein [Caudoviricetes sp.]